MMNPPAYVDYLILGQGYLGQCLEELLVQEKDRGRLVSTSRRAHGADLRFDLYDPSTWTNLPESRFTFWTFPAEPLDLVKQFWAAQGARLGKLVCIGSTSALKVEIEDQWVHEHSGLDLTQARVQGEEFLRSQGAMTLLSAGIYGPHRDPLDWVRRGFVGKSSKYVNMVHVEDLALLSWKALHQGQQGELYIASDSYPQRWDEVITYWQKQGRLGPVAEKISARSSKRVDNSWTLRKLDHQIINPDFKTADLEKKLFVGHSPH
jgi:hypothetical protein